MTQTTECPDGGCRRYPNCPCGITPSETPPELQTTDPLFVFKDGIEAGLLGADPRSCPWDKMTSEWYDGSVDRLGAFS
jgi:hypothetical protein